MLVKNIEFKGQEELTKHEYLCSKGTQLTSIDDVSSNQLVYHKHYYILDIVKKCNKTNTLDKIFCNSHIIHSCAFGDWLVIPKDVAYTLTISCNNGITTTDITLPEFNDCNKIVNSNMKTWKMNIWYKKVSESINEYIKIEDKINNYVDFIVVNKYVNEKYWDLYTSDTSCDVINGKYEELPEDFDIVATL